MLILFSSLTETKWIDQRYVVETVDPLSPRPLTMIPM